MECVHTVPFSSCLLLEYPFFFASCSRDFSRKESGKGKVHLHLLRFSFRNTILVSQYSERNKFAHFSVSPSHFLFQISVRTKEDPLAWGPKHSLGGRCCLFWGFWNAHASIPLARLDLPFLGNRTVDFILHKHTWAPPLALSVNNSGNHQSLLFHVPSTKMPSAFYQRPPKTA